MHPLLAGSTGSSEIPEDGLEARLLDFLSSLTDSGTGWLMLGFLVLATLAAVAASCGAFAWCLSRFERRSLAPMGWNLIDILIPFVAWALLEIGFGQVVMLLPFLLGAPIDLPAEALGLWGDAVTPVLLVAGTGIRFACVAMVLLQLRLGSFGGDALGVSWSGIGAGVRSGVLALVAILPAWILLAEVWTMLVQVLEKAAPQGVVEKYQEAVARGAWFEVALMAMAAGVAAPLFEEVLFRGLLFRWLDHHLPVAGSVAISSILFAAIHGSWLAFLPLVVLGAALALVYRRTGNLWSAVSMHVAFNVGMLILMTVSS